MNTQVFRLCAGLLLSAILVPSSQLMAADVPSADETTFQKTIRPLLKKHCFRCHGENKQEAGFRVDRLGADFLKERSGEIWHELLNRVNAGEMPPKKEPQLSTAEFNQLSEWGFRELKRTAAASQNQNGRVVIRRLNREEYNNTIRDLVGIPFDAGADFPADPAAFGFDNVGSALSVSPLHLEKYLLAARKVINRAIVTGEPPKRERWRIQTIRRSKEDRGYYFENDAKYGNTGVFTGEARKDRGRLILWALGSGSKHYRDDKQFVHLSPVEKTRFRGDVLQGIDFNYPVDGEYIIRVHAYGHYPKRKLSETLLFGPPRLNVTSEGLRVFTQDVTATAEDPQVYEGRFYTEALQTTIYIRNRYDYSVGQLWKEVGRISHQSPEFPVPYLAVDWYEIDGPVYDSWPPESHTRILFDSKNRKNENVYAREVIEAFANRAFRRPASAEEVDRFVAIFETARPNKPNFEEAIKVPLIAVLCSPSFLFLSEPLATEQQELRPLNDYEFASRLSYFLWKSMPDDELMALAANGNLRDQRVLKQQVNRMLKDEKSEALVRNFTDQWLGLRKLGETVPDDRLFPLYGEHLEESMAEESRAFFAELLHNDLSVMNFIDADFTMLNERLARFYEIPGVVGDHFRKVALKPEDHRGGLLTQAAMLTLTSNGTRTSPVKRGMWILENILGDPPPPPPPDAGEIPPPKITDPKQLTVRKRLALHRSVPSCAACHTKIDPLGFALENYDASGYYRTQESKNGQLSPHVQDPQIDASGELPDGRKFQDVEELKKILLKQEDQFLDCLAEKMLVYSLGRGLSYTDRPTIERLRESMKQNNYLLRTLITEIVNSQAFQTK